MIAASVQCDVDGISEPSHRAIGQRGFEIQAKMV